MKIIVIALSLLALCACKSNAERRHAFYTDCIHSGFNAAQCKILWRQQQLTRDARDNAALAVGLSAVALSRPR